MTMYVVMLVVAVGLAVVAVAARIRFVKNQQRLRAVFARVPNLIGAIGLGIAFASVVQAQTSDVQSFDEQLLERYADLDVLMAFDTVDDETNSAEPEVAESAASDETLTEEQLVEVQPILEAMEEAAPTFSCPDIHAKFASLTIEQESLRPDWLDQPLFNAGRGDHWISVSSDPMITETEAAMSLDESIYNAVTEYVDDQIGRRGAARRIGLTMNEIHQQHIIVEQFGEVHESSVGPMQIEHARLVFTPQFRAEMGERWKQHLVTTRLFKTSVGIGAVMGLMFIAFGVLKRLGGAAS